VSPLVVIRALRTSWPPLGPGAPTEVHCTVRSRTSVYLDRSSRRRARTVEPWSGGSTVSGIAGSRFSFATGPRPTAAGCTTNVREDRRRRLRLPPTQERDQSLVGQSKQTRLPHLGQLRPRSRPRSAQLSARPTRGTRQQKSEERSRSTRVSSHQSSPIWPAS
jgi:hypothetical protein